MGKIDSRIEILIKYASIFPCNYRSGKSLRKTAVSFPSDETAACLSTSLLLATPKDHARSVSEAFFLSNIPDRLTQTGNKLSTKSRSIFRIKRIEKWVN
jgi:hypothetical protein